jgi:chorismate mutase
LLFFKTTNVNLRESILQQRPFLIAGPCSVESPEQLRKTLESFPALGIKLIRGGIWKPRTRPDSFEGIGTIGLEWLVSAGKEVGIPVATEVANRQHVEEALHAGVDVVWIGARTTVNPFAVQEIADSLRGSSVAVMVKNPVNPDLELWLGAIERIENAGIKDVSAIHRGFSFYKHPVYRNVPNWEIPIALRERRPDLAMICDPSHITGKRSLIAEVAQQAMDLNFDGLMIETHFDPDNACSDAAQQITPNELRVILSELVLRSRDASPEIALQLEEIRSRIASLDETVLRLISERMVLSREVGQFKKENHIMILQQEHWWKIIRQTLESAESLDLSPAFIRQIMDAIHQESIRHQLDLVNKTK